MFANNTLTEIYNKYREGRLAHAYLIETNSIPKLEEDLKELIKALNCPIAYQKECDQCNLCNLIKKNNLPSLITIEPIGVTIKKEQIENLKVAFETKPIYSKYNIYIIKNADKLNGSSANAMLKFVEEPTEGIIGFFITSNKDIIIPTIKSRCQSLVIQYDDDKITTKINLSNEEWNEYKTVINKYLDQIFTGKMIKNKDVIMSVFPERKEIEKMFKIIFEMYYNQMQKNLNKDYDEELTSIYKIDDTLKDIVIKMNIISKFLQDLSYNVNIELLLDKFVVEMRENHG